MIDPLVFRLLCSKSFKNDATCYAAYAQVAAVAVLCVQPEPSYRPLIMDVLHSLVPLVPVELGGTLRTTQPAPSIDPALPPCHWCTSRFGTCFLQHLQFLELIFAPYFSSLHACRLYCKDISFVLYRWSRVAGRQRRVYGSFIHICKLKQYHFELLWNLCIGRFFFCTNTDYSSCFILPCFCVWTGVIRVIRNYLWSSTCIW